MENHAVTEDSLFGDPLDLAVPGLFSGLQLISTLSPLWYSGYAYKRLLLSRSPYTDAEVACYMAARVDNQWQSLESFKDQWNHVDDHQHLALHTATPAQLLSFTWPEWLEYLRASDHRAEIRIRPTLYESIHDNVLQEAGPVYTHQVRLMVVIVVYRASNSFIHVGDKRRKRADDLWASFERSFRLYRSWAQYSRLAHPHVTEYFADRPMMGSHLERVFIGRTALE